MSDRRTFIKNALGLTVLTAAIQAESCITKGPYSHIKGSIVGANHKAGHILRDGKEMPAPSTILNTEVLIVGGGIAGLSAQRWLNRNGVTDVMLVELDNRVGGNSVYGSNEVSAYPWGAHYLPIPDLANKELIDFLHSIDVIKSFDQNGQPVYNEYHLCHDPEERLYIKGHWQEGIVPAFGIGAADKQDMDQFFKLVADFKEAKGNDGKYAFCIPLDASSSDEQFRTLDNITFARYLDMQNLHSGYLRWYLEYCCKDDYGGTLEQTSAWAGIHYFASRRGKAVNASSSDILTWPEGNGYLMEGLKKQISGQTLTDHPIYKIEEEEGGGVSAYCFDITTNKTIRISARKTILATPQYVNKRILQVAANGREQLYAKLHYTPWVIANITLNSLPQHKGAQLSWDNVIYGQPSVGYVFANHQHLQGSSKGVITYYLPLTGDAKKMRMEVYNRDYNHWRKHILTELNFAHQHIANHVSHIDIWVWGHGMILPTVDYIWGAERQLAMAPINNTIFFAHTDLSGISIFEEGFYQGIRAAKEIIAAL